MGMGKTSQIIALLSIIFNKTGVESTDRMTLNQRKRDPDSCERPALIIVPASLIDNWFIELNAWGYFDFHTLRKKKEREEVLEALKHRQIEGVVISYESMKGIIKELKKIDFSVIIFDEAHRMKSLSTQVSTCLLAHLLTHLLTYLLTH